MATRPGKKFRKTSPETENEPGSGTGRVSGIRKSLKKLKVESEEEEHIVSQSKGKLKKPLGGSEADITEESSAKKLKHPTESEGESSRQKSRSKKGNKVPEKTPPVVIKSGSIRSAKKNILEEEAEEETSTDLDLGQKYLAPAASEFDQDGDTTEPVSELTDLTLGRAAGKRTNQRYASKTNMELMHIRCTCNKVFNQKYQDVRETQKDLIKQRMIKLIDKGYTEQDALDYLYEHNLDMKRVMDDLGLRRICCRRTFMTTIQIPFPRSNEEIANRLKKMIPALEEVERISLSKLPKARRDKIIANSHRLLIPDASDIETESRLVVEDSDVPTAEDMAAYAKIKTGFNFSGYEYVGAGYYVQVLAASRLDDGSYVRTYLAR